MHRSIRVEPFAVRSLDPVLHLGGIDLKTLAHFSGFVDSRGSIGAVSIGVSLDRTIRPSLGGTAFGLGVLPPGKRIKKKARSSFDANHGDPVEIE